jgi:hypothetical protein
MGKAKTQPETQMSVSSSQRENSRPPNYPQLQSRCSRAVLEGNTQVNPDFATYLIPCESFISMIKYKQVYTSLFSPDDALIEQNILSLFLLLFFCEALANVPRHCFTNFIF